MEKTIGGNTGKLYMVQIHRVAGLEMGRIRTRKDADPRPVFGKVLYEVSKSGTTGRRRVEEHFGRRKSEERKNGSIKKWNHDNMIFYPQLEDKVRKKRLLQQQNVDTNILVRVQGGGICTKNDERF